MAITRTAITDDSGAGTDGTVLNNSWKTELYDQVDADIQDWTSVTYAGGNFTATGGGTWTVDSGDQAAFKYCKLNRQITFTISLDTTSITGTVSKLNIALPIVSVKNVQAAIAVYDNSATVASLCVANINNGTSTLTILRGDFANFTASTNNTYVRLSITYEW